MPRLLRMLSLTTIHVMAVCTVITWGVAQVGTPVVNTTVGKDRFGVAAHPEGFIFGLWSSNNLSNGILFLPPDNAPKWTNAFHSASPRTRILADHLWIERMGREVFVGIRYWAALLALLTAYVIVRYVFRKSRIQSALQA